MPRVSVTVLFALVAAHVMTLTAALGACKTTLHGELVARDDPRQLFRVIPQQWLFFSLSEIVQENGYTAAKSFQSFTFPNAKTTFPIPFALNIDSPKDCPKELSYPWAAPIASACTLSIRRPAGEESTLRSLSVFALGC